MCCDDREYHVTEHLKKYMETSTSLQERLLARARSGKYNADHEDEARMLARELNDLEFRLKRALEGCR